MLNLVELEGPPAVYMAAADLMTYLSSEFKNLAEVAKICEKNRPIMLSGQNVYLEAKAQRSERKQKFFDAAQTALISTAEIGPNM